MNAKDILLQVLKSGNTENFGMCVSGFHETASEFIERWFGAGVVFTAGGYKNNTEYIYSYDEPLRGIADAIIDGPDFRVYLYEVED